MGVAYGLVAADGAAGDVERGTRSVVDTTATAIAAIVIHHRVAADGAALDAERAVVPDAATAVGIAAGDGAVRACVLDGQVATCFYPDDPPVVLVALGTRSGEGVAIQVEVRGLLDDEHAVNVDVCSEQDVSIVIASGLGELLRCGDEGIIVCDEPRLSAHGSASVKRAVGGHRAAGGCLVFALAFTYTVGGICSLDG